MHLSLLISGLVSSITATLMAWGIWGLALIAFMEAMFFPVPPDVLLVPLSIMKPHEAWWYALLCTLMSTGGGLFARWIGERAGRPLLLRIASPRTIQQTEDWLRRYGGWGMALVALTPAPDKVFNVAAGVLNVPWWLVAWGLFAGRAVRHFSEAAACVWLGPRATVFLSHNLTPATLILAAAFIIWLWLRFLREHHKMANRP